MYVVGPKELLLDDHKVCIQGTHQFISKVGTVDSSFPVHLCIIDIIDTFGSTQPKKSHQAEPATIFRIFGKSFYGGFDIYIYISHETSTCLAPL